MTEPLNTVSRVQPRDPRLQFWVQTQDSRLEPRLGTSFVLSNGTLGLRGTHEECPTWGDPQFYIADTYTGGPPSLLGFHDPDHILTHPDRMDPATLQGVAGNAIVTLPNFPFPLAVALEVGGRAFSYDQFRILSNERVLEMEQAVLRRRFVFRDEDGRRTQVDAKRFVSFADRHLVCLRYQVTPLNHTADVQLRGRLKQDVTNPGGVVLWRTLQSVDVPSMNALECETTESRIRVAIAQSWQVRTEGASTVLELCVIAGRLALEDAVQQARRSGARGFDRLLNEHLEAWNRETEAAELVFDGDVPTVQGVNFGQMHLNMAFCRHSNRTGVPVKGLTGSGYRFLNFWDMDFHLFPYYLMTKPRAARNLLEYRFQQLDAYRENARKWGARGAQVPWETAVSGREETAPWLCLQDREIHISADAAYMFKLYDELTPDGEAMRDMGAEFVLETARFYASRIRWNAEKTRADLPGIGCPDQYHTFADNNVFVSRMALWNIEYALQIAARPDCQTAVQKVGLSRQELAEWRRIRRCFFVRSPDAQGLIEEFDGFFSLSPDLDGVCETFCRHTQAVKQPDVVALFVYFEDEYSLPVRQKNWQFYADRTMHGSSLSLPGMAYGAARCGLNDEALYNLQKSARMDLDDVNLDTVRGVHLSGYAVQWYAIVFGFGGLTPRREFLQIRPNLPRQWNSLTYTVHWQFQRLQVRIAAEEVQVQAWGGNDRPVRLRLGRAPVCEIPPGQVRTFKCKVRRTSKVATT